MVSGFVEIPPVHRKNVTINSHVHVAATPAIFVFQQLVPFVCPRSNVWKKYGKKEAVKGLNLALKANECFGLLGSNGAGKTTTFKMLTGDIKNTAGDIYVCGVNVSNNREKVNNNDRTSHALQQYGIIGVTRKQGA